MVPRVLRARVRHRLLLAGAEHVFAGDGLFQQAASACLHAAQLLAASTAWFTARRVVGDHQRVAVEHGALETGIGAHVLADLLAQEAGVGPGGQRIEQHPEQFPVAPVERGKTLPEIDDGSEEADEGEARPQREHHPQQVLGRLAPQLLRRPRAGIEAQPLRTIAFDPPLGEQEHFGPHGLRTGVAAPQPTRQRGEEKQRQRRDDQQQGEEQEILRPEQQAEDMELARRQIQQQRLPAMPREPGQKIKHAPAATAPRHGAAAAAGH